MVAVTRRRPNPVTPVMVSQALGGSGGGGGGGLILSVIWWLPAPPPDGRATTSPPKNAAPDSYPRESGARYVLAIFLFSFGTGPVSRRQHLACTLASVRSFMGL